MSSTDSTDKDKQQQQSKGLSITSIILIIAAAIIVIGGGIYLIKYLKEEKRKSDFNIYQLVHHDRPAFKTVGLSPEH